MVLRSVIGAALALAIAASPALACTGQEIYSDDFAAADGPWDHGDWINIGGGYAEVKLQPGFLGVVRFLGDLPKEFDLCVDVTFPQSANPDGVIGGIALWHKDYENTYYVAMTPSGLLGAIRVAKNRGLVASPYRKQPSIKAGAGAKNTLRVTAKGNTATVYINGQRAISFRGIPEEAYVGLYAETLQQEPQPVGWQFSNFKLTEAP